MGTESLQQQFASVEQYPKAVQRYSGAASVLMDKDADSTLEFRALIAIVHAIDVAPEKHQFMAIDLLRLRSSYEKPHLVAPLVLANLRYLHTVPHDKAKRTAYDLYNLIPAEDAANRATASRMIAKHFGSEDISRKAHDWLDATSHNPEP